MRCRHPSLLLYRLLASYGLVYLKQQLPAKALLDGFLAGNYALARADKYETAAALYLRDVVDADVNAASRLAQAGQLVDVAVFAWLVDGNNQRVAWLTGFYL